ncbi:MAG TPA: diadenylate cyclase CdaA [Phycisphaerales bacterium]|nr:diadenylate cyclase CdaA [Phycisphaerales bacterium]
MGILERIQGLQQRLAAYSAWEVAVELAVIWVVVFLIFRFVRGTRAVGALKGLLVILVVATVLSRILSAGASFQRLSLLYDKFLALVAVGLIVIFQPELRRALVRLGETSLLRSTPTDIRVIVEEVADAAHYLSRAKFGALIVLERQIKVAGLVEGGTKLGAELTSRLLQTIFFPGSALHDLACVVKGRVIDAAGVQLPLADPQDMPDPTLGSRHRAAVGLTQECDAIVVVVSEETGAVRLAERGRLSGPLSDENLREELTRRLTNAIRRRLGDEPAPAPVPRERTAQERREQEAMMESVAGMPSPESRRQEEPGA